jgi:hypothetical protein
MDSMHAFLKAKREALDPGDKRQILDEKSGPATAQDRSARDGQKERRSYAMGMVLGNEFRKQAIEVDLDLYVRGLKDAFHGRKTLLTETEARGTVTALQHELKRKRSAPPSSTALSDIKVFFKLDSRLTRAQYLGDRRVSPPTYASTLQKGTELTVEARAQGLDVRGRPLTITAGWISSDSVMVTVSPVHGNEVRIIVKKAGQIRLKVVSQELTKELHIKAMDRDNAMQVEISQ